MKGICLCSGGLDSTLALLKLLKDGNTVTPMFIDYNQWSSEGEKVSVFLISGWLKCNPVDIADWLQKGLPGSHSTFSFLDTVKIKVDLGGSKEKIGSVWGRNIALVGLAAMWAYTHGNDYDFIALGNHRGDVGPDCKPGFFDSSLSLSLKEATKEQLSLVLPIRELTVEDIGKELSGFGIPWDLMYSCYWYPPCGFKSPNEDYRCPGCRRKAIAMKAGGATPEALLLPNCKEITYQSELAEPTDY